MKSALRRLVVQRAQRRCEYCQLPMDLVPFAFEIDHVIARRHGGPTASENLALACLACNNHKGPCIGCLEPRSRRFVRLFHPRRDRWRRHFRGMAPVSSAERQLVVRPSFSWESTCRTAYVCGGA